MLKFTSKKFSALIFAVTTNLTFAQDQTILNIISTYQANQARFHAQLKSKTLSGTGVVNSVETDILGTGSIFFVNLNVSGSKVKCSTADKNTAAIFDKGQTINFEGKIDDVIQNQLILVECNFHTPQKKVQNIPKTNSNENKLKINPQILSKRFNISTDIADKIFSANNNNLIDFQFVDLHARIDLNKDGNIDYIFEEKFCGNIGCNYYAAVSIGNMMKIYELGYNIELDKNSNPPKLIIGDSVKQWKNENFQVIDKKSPEFVIDCKNATIFWQNNGVFYFNGPLNTINNLGTLPHVKYIIKNSKREILDGSRASGYDILLFNLKKQCPNLPIN